MATDVQSIFAVRQYVPFERPPDPIALWTAIPRGLVSGIVAAAELDAKVINDDALLNIFLTLPPGFGYVMNDCNLVIAGQVSAWNNFCTLNMQNFYRCDPSLAVGLSSNWLSGFESSALFNVSKTLTKNGDRSTPWPTDVLFPTPGSSGVLTTMSASNGADPATTAGTVDYFISFWQYDLEQVRKFPINTAIRTY